jgi:hypothetical protein
MSLIGILMTVVVCDAWHAERAEVQEMKKRDEFTRQAGAPAQGPGSTVQALEGIHAGPATAISHPRGWFTLEAPQSWSVAEQGDSHMLINPGLGTSDSLDALVVVSYGELDALQARADLVALFSEVKPAIIRDLALRGIEVRDSGAPPRIVQLAHTTGLVQEWPGRAGAREVRTWFGGLVKDGYFFTVTGVVLAGREDRFLPGVKRLFFSANPRPPQRNVAAEQELAGAEFWALETRPGGTSGSFSTTFALGAGGRVKKTMTVSGMTGFSTHVGGESEEWGTYEVVGDEVTFTFGNSRDTLRILLEQSQIVGLERAGRVYRRR